MPGLREDTMAGSADISGDPKPTRPLTAGEKDQATQSKVNRTQQGPQAKPQKQGGPGEAIKHGLQQAGDALGKAAKKPEGQRPDKGQGYENAPQVLADQGQRFLSDVLNSGKLTVNPFAPGDWFQNVKDDAGSAWSAAQDLYDTYSYITDPKRLNASIRSTWAKDDARSRITQALMTAYGYQVLGSGNMGMGLGFGASQAIADQLTQGRGSQQSEAVAEKAIPKAVELGTDPTNWTPSGKAAIAGGVAKPMAEGLMGGHPDPLTQKALDVVHQVVPAGDSTTDKVEMALLWAGIAGGIMGAGHMKGPMREFLAQQFENWPKIQDTIKEAVKQSDKARKIAQDPFRADMPNHVQAELDAANSELEALNKPRVVEKANLKTNKQGEVVQKRTDAQLANRQKLFKSVGVNSEAELKKYAGEHGLTPRQTDLLEKHYKSLLFTDPLLSQGTKEGQYLDPRRHFDTLKGEDPQMHSRAVDAATGFHVLREMGEVGPWQNGLSPVQSILRGAVGWNHTLDIFEGNFRDSLRAVDPKLDGKELMRIVEAGAEGKEDYDKLSTSGKYVADMYRLYAHMTGQYERRAGVKIGQATAYVPRIPEYVSPMKRSRGGSPKDILTPEWGKGRLWRTTAEQTFASVKPSELQPLRRQLGPLGKDLTDDEMAPLFHVIDKMGQQDGEALMTFLRNAKSPAAVRKTIDEWWQKGLTPNAEHLRLKMVPAFKTVDDHNAYMATMRRRFPEVLLSAPEDAPKLAKEASGVRLDLSQPEYARIIKEKDAVAAEDLAKHLFPNARTDLFDVLGSQHFAGQMKAAHSAEVMKELEKTVVRVEGADYWAARKRSKDNRADKHLRDMGYREVKNASHAYQDYIFAPEVAKFIEKATRYRDLGWWEKLATIESKMVGLIMYSPMVHGMNMAGRFGAYGLSQFLQGNGSLLIDYAKAGKALTPAMRDQESQLLRMEPWSKGLVTPHQARTVASDMGNMISNALGETKMRDLGVNRENPITEKAKALAEWGPVGKVKSFNEAGQRMLWGQIADFGVAVYHIEKAAAMRRGVPQENAEAWAVRRGNTWMGHVSELDHNPTAHSISRLLMFAPNWWRTFGELMMPVYRNSGMKMDAELSGYVARQQVATMISLIAMQKIIGNAMNMVTSGHGQWDNEPGHQDDIELGFLGQNDKTGGKHYMENVFARQQRSVETLAGLQSGHEDWQPGDVFSGGEKFIAARASPLVNGLAALSNVDLYGSLSTQTWRNINPDHQNPDGWNLIYAMMMGSPLSHMAQPMAREMSEGNDKFAGVDGPYGTKVPKFLADMAKGSPGAMVGIITSLLGVNSPYEASTKTRGTQLSDEDYRRLKTANDTYHKQLDGISQEALEGKLTPGQWRDQYHQLSTLHRGAMSIFNNRPEYANGTMGMIAEWEGLYSEATDSETGQLDADKLAGLQDEFRQKHDQASLDAMQAELRKGDQKNQMLKMYHGALDSYHQWQAQYAAESGVSVRQIQDESASYNALRADKRAAAQYLAEHPELKRYHTARSREFYRSQQGLLYGLFVDSSVALSYARQQGMTSRDVVEQMAAQQ